jgi:hypothetical protein
MSWPGSENVTSRTLPLEPTYVEIQFKFHVKLKNIYFFREEKESGGR